MGQEHARSITRVGSAVDAQRISRNFGGRIRAPSLARTGRRRLCEHRRIARRGGGQPAALAARRRRPRRRAMGGHGRGNFIGSRSLSEIYGLGDRALLFRRLWLALFALWRRCLAGVGAHRLGQRCHARIVGCCGSEPAVVPRARVDAAARRRRRLRDFFPRSSRPIRPRGLARCRSVGFEHAAFFRLAQFEQDAGTTSIRSHDIDRHSYGMLDRAVLRL